MYGLKQDIDLSFLKGRELTQIAIGLYHISFRFDEDVAISVEAEFHYFDGETEWTWKYQPNSSAVAGRALALLGSTIETFQANREGTLTLSFSNGQRLTVLDSSKEYESYDITCPGKTIVV